MSTAENADDAQRLEQYYQYTWQCSKCGGRHALMCNYCPDAKGAAIQRQACQTCNGSGVERATAGDGYHPCPKCQQFGKEK